MAFWNYIAKSSFHFNNSHASVDKLSILFYFPFVLANYNRLLECHVL
jgi:hypothetical protein